MHAKVLAEDFTSKTKKRKAQRDPDASKKQAGPKRQRKDLGSLSSTDIAALNQDEHLNGPNSPNLGSNKFDRSPRNNALSKVPQSTPNWLRGETIEPNSPLPEGSKSSDLQKKDLLFKKSGSSSDYDSEDEAPETVSAAAGLLQSRQAAAEVAKAEEMQASPHIAHIYSIADRVTRKKAATKSKRREHDARLKLQAKSAKSRVLTDQMPTTSAPRLETGSKATVIGSHDASEAIQWSIGDPLPELLPDEILAALPETSSAPVSLNLKSRKDPVKNKVKIFQTISKRIKRGSIVYQVLEDDGGILPPKVAKRSMSLRESWLRGRRGPRGEEIVRRRKVGGGFVRK